jgi:hypothetical protein
MTQDEKKPRGGKPIGGIGRPYVSIGGRSSQVPVPPDARTSEPQSVEASERQGVETLVRQSVQTSKPKRVRNRTTVWLEPELDSWIRHRIADTREEISDVVNEAVRRLMTGD